MSDEIYREMAKTARVERAKYEASLIPLPKLRPVHWNDGARVAAHGRGVETTLGAIRDIAWNYRLENPECPREMAVAVGFDARVKRFIVTGRSRSWFGAPEEWEPGGALLIGMD
jgi:hypothetical protein